MTGMFRGLHIGIDRYADPNVQWLSGAVRDAEALHAMFAGTSGTGAVLLTDKALTRDVSGPSGCHAAGLRRYRAVRTR